MKFSFSVVNSLKVIKIYLGYYDTLRTVHCPLSPLSNIRGK